MDYIPPWFINKGGHLKKDERWLKSEVTLSLVLGFCFWLCVDNEFMIYTFYLLVTCYLS